MAILCETCKNFKPAYDPQMMKAIYGYCRAWEYPLLQAIFMEATIEKFPTAFPAPKECELYHAGKGKVS